MKSFLHSPLLLALVNLLFLHTSPLFGQTAAPVKVKKLPFHGKIVAIDAAAQTITLNGKSARVMHVASTTTIVDGSGNPTTFSTATVGEDVGGSYIKDASGTLTLSKLRIGAKAGSKEAAEAAAPEKAATATTPAPTPAPAAAPTTPEATAASDAATATKPAATKKSHFSGKVTAVDAASSTFTIKARTFTTTPTTKITDSTGTAASLADVAVGAKVTGSYEKSADGTTMTVDTLKIAK
jgi:hypothetical protein